MLNIMMYCQNKVHECSFVNFLSAYFIGVVSEALRKFTKLHSWTVAGFLFK